MPTFECYLQVIAFFSLNRLPFAAIILWSSRALSTRLAGNPTLAHKETTWASISAKWSVSTLELQGCHFYFTNKRSSELLNYEPVRKVKNVSVGTDTVWVANQNGLKSMTLMYSKYSLDLIRVTPGRNLDDTDSAIGKTEENVDVTAQQKPPCCTPRCRCRFGLAQQGQSCLRKTELWQY